MFLAHSASASTYYVWANGGHTACAAADKTAAQTNSQSTAFSMAGIKACSGANALTAGDQVLFSSAGGNFTTALTIPSGGSTGTGNEITYANVPTETPVITGNLSPMISTNSKSNIIISGFSLIYAGSNAYANGIGILGDGSSNIALNYNTVDMNDYGWGIVSGNNNLSSIVMDHNSLSDSSGIYLYGTGLANISLTNHTSAGTGTGAYIKNTAGITVTDFTSTSNSGGYIIYIQGSSGVITVTDVALTSFTGRSLFIFDTTDFGEGSIISGITADNVGAVDVSYGAISFKTCTGTLTANDITLTGTQGNALASIYVYNSTFTSANISASVSSTAKTGFEVWNSSGITFTDCYYSGTGPFGYYVDSSSSNIAFNFCTSDGATTSAGFYVRNASNISYTDCTAINSAAYGFWATTSEIGTTNTISYLRCHAGSLTGPNVTAGFSASGSVNSVTYTNCDAQYNGSNGFHTVNNTSNVTYLRCVAHHNGTVNVNVDGGGFIPHNAATDIKNYFCIAYSNYNEGISDVSTGTNDVYNSVNWANGYALGDTFRGSTVTTPTTARGNMYLATDSVIYKNIISGTGEPRERSGWTDEATGLDYNLYNPLDDNAFSTSDGGLSQISWATYHTTNGNESNSQNADPLFVNATGNYTADTDFKLTYLSPAIDAGTTAVWMTSTTTDYDNKPIYGTPDIGAYEYQPPHSLTLATPDTIDVGAGARIYADGKFRDLTTTNSTSAHLKITPSGGSFTTYDATTTRPAYLDVTNIANWTSTHKTWTESNAQSSVMVTDHTVGDLDASKWYIVTVTGITDYTKIAGISGTTCTAQSTNAICQADGSGQLSFEYSGGYSTHTFDMTEDTTAPTNVGISSISQDSTTQLTVTASTATDADSGLATAPYWFEETSGNPGAVSSTDWQTSPVFVNTNLSCGMPYSYRVKAKDNNGNISDFSTTTPATTRNCGGGSTYYTISVFVTPNGSISPGSQMLMQGDSSTFNVTPYAGYQIADILVDDVSIGAKQSYTFNNIAQSHTILANFSELTSTTEDTITLTPQQKAVLISQIKQQLIALITQLIQLLALQVRYM